MLDFDENYIMEPTDEEQQQAFLHFTIHDFEENVAVHGVDTVMTLLSKPTLALLQAYFSTIEKPKRETCKLLC